MMDRLPPELIASIVSFVVGNSCTHAQCLGDKYDRNGRLAGLATLSRKFQRAVEPHLFSHLTVQWADLAFFEKALVRKRRSYLKSLAFVVNHQGRGTYQTSNETDFVLATSELFRVLNSWDDDSARKAFRPFNIPLSLIVENRRNLPSFRTETDSRTIISSHFFFPLYGGRRHPSTHLTAVSGAPFRQFGVTDMCGTALWEVLTGVELDSPSAPGPSLP